jgi:N-acetylmuramoyl-L-alanine amidase
MRVINEIILHCSATPEGKDIKTETIRQWHINDNKWKDIGYHYVIELNGNIVEGRNIEIAGAHTKGRNANSIGICYIGGCDKNMKAKDTRTEAQKQALNQLLSELRIMYPNTMVRGHREFSNKDCPSFDVQKEYGHLNNYII